MGDVTAEVKISDFDVLAMMPLLERPGTVLKTREKSFVVGHAAAEFATARGFYNANYPARRKERAAKPKTARQRNVAASIRTRTPHEAALAAVASSPIFKSANR